MKKGTMQDWKWRLLSIALIGILLINMSGMSACVPTETGETPSPPVSESRLIKINEVMFNPFGLDAGGQWVELYNSGTEAQGLRGWTVSNREGSALFTLPDLELPAGSYLVIWFGTGIDDTDFSDEAGTVYTGADEEVLSSEDEFALYAGTPGSSTIRDFISWSSSGDYTPGTAHDYAVEAFIWDAGAVLDFGFPSGKSMVGGYSMGRDKDSTDTDEPEDWDRNGGTDAYFDTPAAQNAGPYFTTDEGIRLIQTKANLMLMQWGHKVIDASHQVLSQQQTADETYVRAKHSFTTDYAGYQDTFSGIGEYRWERVDSSLWSGSVILELLNSFGDEDYSLQYTRTYQDSSLVQVITENTEVIYGQEIFDEEEILPDEDETLEPLTEASTHREEKGFTDQTTTTVTQTALGEYLVQVESDKDLAFRGERQTLSFTKDYQILSDTQMEASTTLAMTSDMRESVSISTHYVLDTDVGWHRSEDLGYLNASYSQYDLEVGDQSYSLAEPGYFRIEKVAGQDRYNIEWNIVVGDGETKDLGGSGYIERSVVEGEVIYSGIISNNTTLDVWQFYIDGWESAVGGGVCAIAGGLIGLLFVGVGSVIGGGIGAAACGAAGAAIEAATEPDTTKPTIEWEILDSGSDKEKGWLRVKVTVTDDTEVSSVGMTAKSEEGRTLANRSYRPGAESWTKTYRFNNRWCRQRVETVTVTATDSSGNTKTDSRQFTVPARICNPNVEETSPADDEASVPVDRETRITFCKPMNTTATQNAITITPAVAYTTSWSEYKDILTLTPIAPLEYATTYTVTIGTGALSFADLPLEEPYSFSFTTEESPYAEVLGIYPEDGATAVPVETGIEISFSKPMDLTSVQAAIIITPEIEYEILWIEEGLVAFIQPVVPLKYETVYSVTVGTEATSQDGLGLQEPFEFSFETLPLE